MVASCVSYLLLVVVITFIVAGGVVYSKSYLVLTAEVLMESVTKLPALIGEFLLFPCWGSKIPRALIPLSFNKDAKPKERLNVVVAQWSPVEPCKDCLLKKR